MKKLIASAFAAVMLVAGAGAFSAADAHPGPVAVGDNYVVVDGGDTGVWEESNGCEGLQTEASDCDGNAENGDEDADTKVAP